MITERLMAPGEWGLKLTRDIPFATRTKLKYYGHIVIGDSALEPAKMTDASVLAASRYTGIVRRKDTPYDLAGLGLLAYLGDDRGKGAYLEATLTLTAQTFVQSVTALLPAAMPAGTLTAIGVGTWTQSFQGMTNRDALDTTMKNFGGEYRARHDGKLDAGPAGATSPIYTWTPTTIVTRIGGREGFIKGLEAMQLDVENDVEDYAPRVWVAGSGGNAGANGPATPYKDLFGNALVMTQPLSSPAAAGANVAAVAATEAAARATQHTQVTLSTRQYDIARDVKAGDYIYVWDPLAELRDTANEVRYRGELMRPIKLRVLSVTWPVERGLGVWYRDSAASPVTYIDLTPYVMWEPAGALFEVGAVQRRLT